MLSAICAMITAVGSIHAGNGSHGIAEGVPAVFPSAIEFDFENGTVTLPLFQGAGPNGEDVYYILTETSDFAASVHGGVNWAPKLANALGTVAVQSVAVVDAAGNEMPLSGANPIARLQNGKSIVHFSGTVDFTPDRAVIPGPLGFPLDSASKPGSVGDELYSPLFSTDGKRVFNAPHVLNDTGLHDKVVSIDTDRMAVEMALTGGFYEDDFVLYISTEASVPVIAALEGGTYAPNLAAAPGAGDRNPATSAREPIIPIVNGPMGVDNPERQGLRSAVAGEGSPLNIIREEQECSDPTDCSALFYSPLWDVHPVVWTEEVPQDLRWRLTSHAEVIELFSLGLIDTAAPGGVENPDLGGLRAAGVVVNCPNLFVDQTEE